MCVCVCVSHDRVYIAARDFRGIGAGKRPRALLRRDLLSFFYGTRYRGGRLIFLRALLEDSVCVWRAAISSRRFLRAVEGR